MSLFQTATLTRTFGSLLTVLLTLLLTACSARLPDEIVIKRFNFFPESIEYDAQTEHFLLGSLSEGSVLAVKDDGSHEVLINDRELLSAGGLALDQERRRLLVVNPNLGASLMIYDLDSGRRLHFVDLFTLYPELPHLANDVVLDADGNAYVTDSYAPLMYKVDTEGKASLLTADSRFLSDALGRLGLNGIAYHPDGYLLVIKSSDGVLFKVALQEPYVVTTVAIEESLLISVNGITLHPDGRLIAVRGFPDSMVFALRSSDDWVSAEVVAMESIEAPGATSAVVRAEQVYMLSAHQDLFFNGQPADTFEIIRVDLEE